jgi:acyl-homoserine lactone acylase PvdQ
MRVELENQTLQRSKTRWRLGRGQIAIGALVSLVMVGLVTVLVSRHIVSRSWPQVEGTLVLDGLDAPVTVVRDTHGVPYIFAENAHDFFFTQGFVHAQDRFWEMELNRRRGRGELAHLLGDDILESDEFWSALDLRGVAARELAGMDAANQAALDAYAAGVNGWLATRRLPIEFRVLKWTGREVVRPNPWTPEDSLIVALVLTAQMGAPHTDVSLAGQISEKVGPERAVFLMGGHLNDASGIIPDLPLGSVTEGMVAPSQSWALGSRLALVDGEQAAGGEPLLAVDLPTGLGLPSPWYVMAWNVRGSGGASSHGEGAAGASVPGLPALIVGADDEAAWERWQNPSQSAVVSLLKELAPSRAIPPWQRWLLVASLSKGKIILFGDDQAPQTMRELQALQQDTHSARAARLIPLLVKIEPQGWRQERVTGMLEKWDYRIGDNSQEAVFFAVYQLELARATFGDELGDDLFEAYVARGDFYQVALDAILENPEDEWWNDITTPGRERRDDILRRAYEPALEWIGRNYGDLHMLWEWDIVHGSRLYHALGDAWPWDQVFSRDIYPDGWAGTTNASPGGLPCTGGVCLGGDIYRAKAVYGYRQILDGGAPSTLWFTLLPGQSGHVLHTHYDDLLDEWMAGEYLSLQLVASPHEVQGNVSILELIP